MIVIAISSILAFAAVLAIARMVMGPTLADRIIALDVLLVSLMMAIAVDAANRGVETWLNLLVVIAIIGFTATVALTRYIEREARGERS